MPEPVRLLPDGRPVIWEPNPGPQTRFLTSTADEVLYGGAAGGGKTAGLVAGAIRWAGNPNLRALILRRETTDLDELLTEARRIYPAAAPGASYRGDIHRWTFPAGGFVRFNHCAHETDAFGYQGDEFQYLAFDELTQFSRGQYLEIRSRVRSPHPGLPRFTRNTSNPGGIGHEWVRERWAPWLDPECEVEGLAPRTDPETGARLPPAAAGQVLWFLVDDDKEHERCVPKGTPLAQSRTFIPAKLADNPALALNDPGYVQRIRAMGPVRRRQLEHGDWLVKPSAGLFFKRAWFKFIDAPPAQVVGRVRYWDLAGSPTGDWAAGAKVSRTAEGLFVIESMARTRGTPGEVRGHVRATAEMDGRGVEIDIEQDPGQAGKDQVASYAEMLAGWTVRPRPKRVDKQTAAGPFSSQAEAGNVALVRGPWNEPFIAEAEAFPDGDHDDQIDAGSGAVTALTGAGAGTTLAFAPLHILRQRNPWAV